MLDVDLRAGVGEMFNDAVTFVDYPGELERRELEVLIKLVPFVENDVEERCAALKEEEEKEKNKLYWGGWTDEMMEQLVEKYERMKAAEDARLERLRRGILERAERAFPELRTFTPNYELRVENSAASPQDSFRSVPGESGGGPLSTRVESASEFHDVAVGGSPQPGGNFSAMK